MSRSTPARERLLAKLVPQPNGCWYWTGVVDRRGYGRIGYKGRRSTPLHQAVYDCFIGPIAAGLMTDHVCHTRDESCPGGPTCMHRRCGNPEHLELVSRKANSLRGRSFAARNARKTCCPKDHPYDEANTYMTGGRRVCIACYVERIGKRPIRATAAVAP